MIKENSLKHLYGDGEVICFGSSYKIAQNLLKLTGLSAIVNEKRSFCKNLYNLSILNQIPYHSIESKTDLEVLNLNGALGVSYGFGIIFNQKNIQNFTQGIINIHAGLLPLYRGRHPIAYALLNNDLDLTISIHRIDDNIDQGFLLIQEKIEIDLNDDPQTLSEKTQQAVTSGLLNKALQANHKKDWQVIEKGSYHSPLSKSYNTVNPPEVDSNFLYNLIRIKKPYGGVAIEGKQITRCDFLCSDQENKYDQGVTYRCKDGVIVVLQ